MVVFWVLAAGVGVVGAGAGAGRGAFVVLQGVMYWGIWFNLLLANFNLIPIPPLDGSHVLYHLLPAEIGLRYRQLSRYGILIIMVMIFFFPRALFLLLLPAIFTLRLAMAAISPFALTPFGLF